MKHKFKSYVQFSLFLFVISVMIYSCQKDDDFNKSEVLQINLPQKQRVQTKTGTEVSKRIIDYI